MNTRSILLAALSAGMVLPLASQQRERVRVQEDPRARVWINGEEVNPLDWVANRRARIGVLLDMQAVENDSIGATVSSVTPGGPAAKAGLLAGDVLTHINGERLVRSERIRGGVEEESLAGLRLLELMSKVEPGDTVTIEYRRGRENRSARIGTAAERSLLARDFGDGAFSFRIPSFNGQFQADDFPKGMQFKSGNDFAFGFGGPFADLELAPINPELGSYFGATEGVLVIDTPSRNALGLKGGDVILSVDGRKIRGPASLLRILRSYEPGEVIRLEILRNRNRQTVSSKAERDQ